MNTPRIASLALAVFTLASAAVCEHWLDRSTAAISANAAALPTEEVVITVTATEEPVAEVPAAVEIVSRQEIEARQAVSVAELLATVPGLHLAATGGPGHQTSVFTRGTNSTQTLLLLDGVRLNNPNFAGYDWAHLTPDAVERIEIVRGPFSALYGADAVGGVVNVITRRGGPCVSGRPLAVMARVEAGENAYQRGNLDLSGASGPFTYQFGYFDRDGDGEVANDFYQARGASTNLRWNLGKGLDIGFTGRWQDAEVGLPFSGGTGTPASPYRKSATGETDLILPLTHRVSERWDYNVTLSRVVSDYHFEDPDDAYGFVSSDADTTQTLARVAHNFRLGAHTITLGGEWKDQEVDNGDAYGENLRGDGDENLGFFAQEQWRPNAHLKIDAGVRYDRFDSFGTATSPRLAAAFLWNEEADKVHVSYGESFRTPSVGELYFPFFGNPDLDAEDGRSYEAGYRHSFGSAAAPRSGGAIALTFFRNDIRDLIQYDFVTFALGNLGRVETQGAELTIELTPNSKLWGSASYTYLETEDRASGLELLRRPRHSASVSVTWEPLAALAMNATARYAGQRDDIDNRTFARVRNDAYTRLDVAITGRFGPVSPYLRGENILDEEYSTAIGYPAPGATAVVGVALRY